jgi:hypothetical protein
LSVFLDGKEKKKEMVNVLDPLNMGDHIGYHFLHWLISRYTKFNENIQYNIRTIESGVAVIDQILASQDDDFFCENNRYLDQHYYYRGMNEFNNNYRVNDNDRDENQLGDYELSTYTDQLNAFIAQLILSLLI